MKKNKFFIIFLLILIYFLSCAFSYVNAISNDLQKSVFRLHVIANSNEQYDQKLKYIVRDKVLDYINFNNSEINSKEEIITFITQNLSEIEKIAQNTVIENGYNYSVKVNIGNYPFPKKIYGDIVLPSGFYDSLKIEIGNSEGQNWWCVMFPPLCFVDVTSGIVPEDSKNILKDTLSPEEYNLISENSEDIKLKFKIVELFQNININLAKNN